MVTDDDAHLDSEDDHVGRGGDDQEEVGHVHQPGEGQGAGDIVGLVNLINIKSSSRCMTCDLKDNNAV